MPKWTYRMGWLVVAGLLVAVAAEAQWTWTPQTGRWINLKRLPKETAELQLEFARKLMIEGDYDRAIKETHKFSTYYSDTDLADDNQFLRGEIRQAKGDLKGAANAFQQVVTAHPDTDLYDEVIKRQYAIGDALYERGQRRLAKRWRPYRRRPLKHAIEVYSLVIDNQPFTNEAAEGQYKVGLCQFAREEYLDAAYDYQRVIEDYTGSTWVDDASYGLATCYHTAALPPDYDQTPSQLAIGAVDDFRERFPDDPRGEKLQAKRTEMRERIAQQRLQTARFYEHRRQFRAAHLSYEVVVAQFDGTGAAAEARQWLAENPSDVSPLGAGRS